MSLGKRLHCVKRILVAIVENFLLAIAGYTDTQTLQILKINKMKRFGYLYDRICSYDNLLSAFYHAKHNKGQRKEIVEFERDLEANLRQIQYELQTLTYHTSQYILFKKYEPKERLIYKLPFRDRVVHWAIMLVVEPIWVSNFTRDTFACIKGRGIHPMISKVKSDLRKDVEGTTYCLKLDIRKFYPSIDHEILKRVIRKKIKDPKLLFLLDEIIDSADGVPIGNYLSQFFANLYLSEMDHLIKEHLKVKYYYRYADDMVLLSNDKQQLHGWLMWINDYLIQNRNLRLKDNYSIFPVKNGIDFGGYVMFHTHTLARKRNKKNLCRQIAKLRKKGYNNEQIRLKTASRIGFMKHCDSKHLLQVLEMRKFSEIRKTPAKLDGSKLHIDKILNCNIRITGYEISESKYKGECLTIQYLIQVGDDWEKHISFTGSEALISVFKETSLEDYPVEAMIVKQKIGDKDNFFYNVIDPVN